MSDEKGYGMKRTERDVDGSISVVHRGNIPPPYNLPAAYQEAVRVLKSHPTEIIKYAGMFASIFETLAENYGEFTMDNSGRNVYFVRKGTAFTDFGVVVLRVVHQHSLESVNHFVELLILGSDVKAQIITVELYRYEFRYAIQTIRGVPFPIK